MTTRIRTAHGRILYLAAALSACCMNASCSNDQRFDLTLILRDDLIVVPSSACVDREINQHGGPCLIDFDEQLWRDQAGRPAVVPARRLTVEFVKQRFGDLECGGRTVRDAWGFLAHPLPDSAPFRLELDDGSVLMLSEKQGSEASNFRDVCVEYSGSWRGVAGDLEGRAGSFTEIHDSVQIVLHVVED